LSWRDWTDPIYAVIQTVIVIRITWFGKSILIKFSSVAGDVKEGSRRSRFGSHTSISGNNRENGKLFVAGSGVSGNSDVVQVKPCYHKHKICNQRQIQQLYN
jgi:hypothetical protein